MILDGCVKFQVEKPSRSLLFWRYSYIHAKIHGRRLTEYVLLHPRMVYIYSIGSLRQFNVVFSPQWISVCKIHACKVAYHAPFHPWVYLFIENRLFYCFSHTPPICVDLITISRALKLVSCHVVCDTWWLCEISGRKTKQKFVILTLFLYPC